MHGKRFLQAAATLTLNFGGPDFIEAAFARVVLVDGVGQVVVYSHRAYGNDRSKQIGSWLQANGPRVEQALMAWRSPKLAALERLPQAK